MGLLKFIIVGAAVGYGVNYITKKNESGRSILEDVLDDAPEWVEKVKKYAEDAIEQVSKNVQTKTGL
ncbi:YtxH domain-containing protein [Mucilaginibacter sp.]|uniref:YtxH domain-containing protein n=1 Tax=Mucilaginibacter sp. TaxID=1882438 RepID=UPI003D0D802E